MLAERPVGALDVAGSGVNAIAYAVPPATFDAAGVRSQDASGVGTSAGCRAWPAAAAREGPT